MENKMDFFSRDNILILTAADDKKSKKGGGMLAILELLKEFATMVDKIKACAEAQDITENKSKVEGAGKKIEECFDELLSMVKIRDPEAAQGLEQGLEGDLPSASPETPTPQTPALPSTPSLGM